MKQFPQALKQGYYSFVTQRLPVEQARFKKLAEYGQTPHTMIIACCDSRVAPELIFNAAPGELFVVRNVANLVPPNGKDHKCLAILAALEFAVLSLEVAHIVVMGHGQCGGIAAALAANRDLLSQDDYVGRWIELLENVKPGRDSPENHDLQQKFEQDAIRYSLKNLETFPYIMERITRKKLSTHGAWFDIAKGQLSILDHQTNSFKTLNLV